MFWAPSSDQRDDREVETPGDRNPPGVMWPDLGSGFEPSAYSPAGSELQDARILANARWSRAPDIYVHVGQSGNQDVGDHRRGLRSGLPDRGREHSALIGPIDATLGSEGLGLRRTRAIRNDLARSLASDG
jgi:hypothetical protein